MVLTSLLSFHKQPKQVLIALCIFILLLITTIALSIYIFLFNNNTEQEQQTKEFIFNTKDIADQTAQYLKKNHKTNNGYTHFIADIDNLCNENQDFCKYKWDNLQFPYHIMNSWTSLGFYSAYQVTGNKEYKDQALNDMRLLSDYCLQDNNINNCLWVLVQPALIYSTEKEPYILNLITAGADTLLTSEGSNNLMLKAIEARSLMLAYNITNNEAYKQGALDKFEESQQLLDLVPLGTQENALVSHTCWHYLTATEFAHQLNDIDYILQVYSAFEYYLTEQYDSVGFQPCIEALFIMKESPVVEIDPTIAQDTLQQFTNEFWDGKSNKLVNGTGGVLSRKYHETLTNTYKRFQTPNSTDTSYFIYLLSLYDTAT